jgi:hypothetical protein
MKLSNLRPSEFASGFVAGSAADAFCALSAAYSANIRPQVRKRASDRIVELLSDKPLWHQGSSTNPNPHCTARLLKAQESFNAVLHSTPANLATEKVAVGTRQR